MGPGRLGGIDGVAVITHLGSEDEARTIADTLAAEHPYELPAVLHHRLTGSATYGAWVRDETRPDPEA